MSGGSIASGTSNLGTRRTRLAAIAARNEEAELRGAEGKAAGQYAAQAACRGSSFGTRAAYWMPRAGSRRGIWRGPLVGMYFSPVQQPGRWQRTGWLHGLWSTASIGTGTSGTRAASAPSAPSVTTHGTAAAAPATTMIGAMRLSDIDSRPCTRNAHATRRITAQRIGFRRFRGRPPPP